MTEAKADVRFTPTDEQRLLRDTVRELLEDRASSTRVREVMQGTGTDLELYSELAELGLVGLAIPEEFGGSGSSFVEVAIVIEELGRRLAPVPFLSSAVLGVAAVLHGGDDAQRGKLLPAVASGGQRFALAHLDERGRAGQSASVRARRDGDGWVLNGESGYVIDGAAATTLLVAADTEDEGLAIFVCPAGASGVERQNIDVLDLTRPMASLRFDTVHLEGAAKLAGDGSATLDAALTAGLIAIANEQVGGVQEVLDFTTAYARSRVQFGRAIGSFQAIKHRLAEMLVKAESARSSAEYAARVLAAGDLDEVAIAAPLAKSYCSQVYEDVSADALQIHGGIGFTWEHDIHLYFKRAKATKLLLGSPAQQRARLGDVLGL